MKHAMILTRIPSVAYLWIAIIIFAASNAVTRKVTDIGAMHLVNGNNPISLCNVLLVGNVCALAMMIVVFGQQWNQSNLKQLTRNDWSSLAAIALLSGALAPALIFAALDITNVTNVVLIGRLEPSLTLVFSVLFLKARVNRWTAIGSAVSFVGVVATTLLANSTPSLVMMGGLLHIGRGEWMVAIASFVLAIATVISQSRLQHIPLGIFNIVRVALGTAVFFMLAHVLYGSNHFAEVFSPFLWKWMLFYGSVIVVLGQLCWFAGLRGSTPAMTTLASSFNPIAAIAMAYLILGEVPTVAQYLGGSIILIGILLSLVGSFKEAKFNKTVNQSINKPAPSTQYGQQMGMMTGFRGI